MTDLRYCRIDLDTATDAEIEAEIARLEALKHIETNTEQAIKLLINSVYGAIGSPFFIAYNPAVAEAVTLQGQDIIKYASKVGEVYFQKRWHQDTEVHQKLGIGHAYPVHEGVNMYNDTDSAYLSFEGVMKSCAFEGNGVEFILSLYEHRLRGLFERSMEVYAKRYDTENIQQFELENISYAGIWLAKKKYVLNVAWKDPGISYEDGVKISAKGVEIVRRSTPPFARDKMKELVKYILMMRRGFNLGAFVGLLKEAKRLYVKIDDLDQIAYSSTVNNYAKYVVNDVTDVEIISATPIHIRAAACYNYSVNRAHMKGKYRLLQDKDKIKFYYTKDNFDSVFGYPHGDYPIEIEPPMIDLDWQFYKTVISPLNRFVEVMGHDEIPKGLVVGKAIF